MICEKCGDKYHAAIGVIPRTIAGRERRVFDKESTMRWCINPKCENYGIIQIRCRKHDGWFDAETQKIACFGQGICLIVCPDCYAQIHIYPLIQMGIERIANDPTAVRQSVRNESEHRVDG